VLTVPILFSPLSFPRLLLVYLYSFSTIFHYDFKFFFVLLYDYQLTICQLTVIHRSTALSALDLNCKITILCTVLLLYVFRYLAMHLATIFQ